MTGNAGIKQDDAPEIPDLQVTVEGEQGVTTEGEQSGAPKEDTGDAPPPPRKPRTSPDRRIGQLTAQKNEAERLRAEEKSKFEAELAAERGEKLEATEAALHWGKEALQGQLQIAQRDLKAAKDAGDTEAESSLTVKISGLSAKLANIPTVPEKPAPAAKPEPRAAEPERPAARQPVEQDEAPLPPPVAEDGQATPFGEWVQQNSWFNPEAPEYDDTLHNAARDYADSLERRYIAAGRQKEIGTPAYFQKISNYMHREFPAEGEEAAPPPKVEPRQPPRMPPMTGRSPVAPGTRGGPQNGRSGNVVSLTADEAEYAQVHFNNRKHTDGPKKGQMYSRDDKLKAYALLKQNPNAGPVQISITNKDSRA